MRTRLAGILIAVLVVAVYLYASFFLSNGGGNDLQKMAIVHIAVSHNGTVQAMNAYLASNFTEQAAGLMYRKSLGSCNGYGNCRGMLFTIDNSTPTEVCFWMKNTIMPLNMYWISNGTVLYEAANTVPYSTNDICSIGNWVLETTANTSLPVGSAVSIAPSRGA